MKTDSERPVLDRVIERFSRVLEDEDSQLMLFAAMHEMMAEKNHEKHGLRAVSLVQVSVQDLVTDLPPPPGYLFDSVQPYASVDPARNHSCGYVLVTWRKLPEPTASESAS